jgi:hypothetical protein
MDKDIGKIKKNENTDIIVRIDEYKGKKGITIREYITSEKYTGFSKSGTRIPAEEFLNFRELVNSIHLEDLNTNNLSEKKKKKTENVEIKKKPEETEEEIEAEEEAVDESEDKS